MQWTLRRSVGVNVGAEFRVVIKIGVLNALGGEFESLRPASYTIPRGPRKSRKPAEICGFSDLQRNLQFLFCSMLYHTFYPIFG